ncbi:MAG: response regulator [Proteobacteria bacterium]|nr:response regulator [Pseudomonadota bacterium]MBU1640775.1 response regulator [Pseudomonadota bacterium]
MKKILIVDDENNFLLSLEDGLKEFSDSFSIATANNGKEAVAVMEKEKVNLVITDIKMPDMDGFELLAHLSAVHSDIPVIVMTAFGSSEIEDRLDNMGAFQYIEKPIDFDVLIEKVKDGLAAGEKGHITGVSLASFMQLLSLDKKTCTLKVTSGEHVGSVFFLNGDLMHAFTESLQGQEAALEIACWEPVEIEIQHFCRQRERVIESPLGFVLIESARMKDERKDRASGGKGMAEEEQREKKKKAPRAEEGVVREIDPASLVQPAETAEGFAREIDPASLVSEPEAPSVPPQIIPMFEALKVMEGVTRFAILNREGLLIAELKNGNEFGPYITMLLTATEKLNADLGISAPQSLVINKRTGSKILIIAGPHIIVGLDLSNDASAGSIADSMRPMVQRISL